MSGGTHLREEHRPEPQHNAWTVPVAGVALLVLVIGALGFFGGRDGGSSDVAALDGTGATPPGSGVLGDGEPTVSTTSAVSPPSRGNGVPITIMIAGDTYAEGVLADRLARNPRGFVGPYAAMFAEADLTVLNLESAITEGGTPIPDKQFTFRAPASVLDALAAGGVDVVSVANNHGLDYGTAGLADTVAAKRVSGMVVGIGADEDEAYAPWIGEVKGQTVAVIGATQVLDGSVLKAWTATQRNGGLASAKRVDRLVAAVEEIRDSVDTIVVLLHWGIETHECPSVVQQDLAGALEAAGADLIVGGHAHRVQGGGMLRSAVVHYGLGNFLFKENSAPGARTGVFKVTVAGEVIDGYEWMPGRVRDSIPTPLTGAEAAAESVRWNDQRSCTNLRP